MFKNKNLIIIVVLILAGLFIFSQITENYKLTSSASSSPGCRKLMNLWYYNTYKSKNNKNDANANWQNIKVQKGACGYTPSNIITKEEVKEWIETEGKNQYDIWCKEINLGTKKPNCS